MSTLSVGTVKSVSTAAPVFQNSSGTEIGELIKAWVHFDGYNNTIDASFNISSVTDNGTGDYTFNFTSAFADANYAWSGTGSTAGSTRSTMRAVGFFSTNSTNSNNAQLAGSTRVVTVLASDGMNEYDTDHLMIHWTR